MCLGIKNFITKFNYIYCKLEFAVFKRLFNKKDYILEEIWKLLNSKEERMMLLV